MNRAKNEKFIILLISLACIGLTVESIILEWEFWVWPLIIVGTVSLWVMNLSEKPEYEIRKILYLVYAMLVIFFHGAHESSLFDVAIALVLVMVAYSFMDKVYMMNLLLVEYYVIMIMQLILASKSGNIKFDALNISRVILHFMIVHLVYFCCTRSINNRLEAEETEIEKDRRIESYDADMEDFLTNISHELRTPVNVVNGMSDLMIKRNAGEEAFSIKDAGIRLAYQIEDIQDYTECKRNKVILEEDGYMSTSLINDVVTSFRLIDNSKNLELVVDLAPSVPSMLKGDIRKLHKIFRHLLENAVKFTRQGGVYVKLSTETTEYGVNLCIEMTDTGIGMGRRSLSLVSEGMYQVNKKRNRSSGGIGLGLFIVYGFTHKMGGFVKIESEEGNGTTVRVTIPQKVINDRPCLELPRELPGDLLFHVRSDKYKVPKVRDFYRTMAVNLATGIRAPLYPAETIKDIERLKEKMNIKFIFMGQEEYEENSEYFDEMSKGDIVVAVSAASGFKANKGSRVMIMPKPLYAYPVIKILNEGHDARNIDFSDTTVKPSFDRMKALVVDDEPMNLVVATGLFRDYKMTIETATSGREAISMFRKNDYDVIFMDHMMPEMDGVEAMKKIKSAAKEMGKEAVVIALTANAVSGAREMFMQEGFDGFIAKPINLVEFERVMTQLFPESLKGKEG
ncbi:MAG: response regulator [Lachnospiraceae bacterium]|nr:response regulator [Lachnospiraceae bacterium]